MLSRRDYVTLLMGVGLLICLAAGASAEDRPYLSSNEPDAEKLLENRIRFVADMYQPSGPDMAKIQDALRDLVTPQETYQRQSALTLSRLQLAISIVHHDPNTVYERKLLRINSFQTQFHNMLARAPLSLAHVLRIAEATISSEQAGAGRARMAQKLAVQAKELGIMFDIERIDGIVFGPVEAGPRPAIQLPDRSAPQPLVLNPQTQEKPAPLQPATPSVQPTSPTTPAQTPVAETKPPPPPPSRPLPASTPGAPVPPAPPIAEWKNHLNVATEKYGFNAAQMEAAQGVINQTISFAAKFQESNQASLDEAKAMPDSPEKAARIKELTDPVDRAYDAMVRRIDSLASIEQRNRAAANEKSGG